MERMLKFILLLAGELPAILVSIFIFIHFALNRQARSELRNHGWLVLLIANFLQLLVNLPLPMSYYYMNRIWPATNAYCTWWTYCEFSFNSIGLFLMAWISIERHILIFHAHTMLQRRWKRWLFHFIPIIFCLLWPAIFFFVLVVISPLCNNQWDFDAFICDSPCYFGDTFYSQFDFIFDLVCPVMVIMLANVTLVMRVIYEKISRQQVVNWRRHRKMVLQLWIISSLYIGFWVPLTITLLVQNTIQPSFMANQLETMQFFIYLIPLLLPVICLSALPKLVKRIKNILTRRHLNTIGVITNHRNRGQVMKISTAG